MIGFDSIIEIVFIGEQIAGSIHQTGAVSIIISNDNGDNWRSYATINYSCCFVTHYQLHQYPRNDPLLHITSVIATLQTPAKTGSLSPSRAFTVGNDGLKKGHTCVNGYSLFLAIVATYTSLLCSTSSCMSIKSSPSKT